MERTYLMVKPDGVERGLIGEVVARLEKKGLKLVGAKLMRIDEELATQHYAEHVGKPFFPDLLQFITSGPVFAMVWEGDEAVAIARLMMGKTNPLEAEQGTIRGDFAVHMNRNVIHGSDSVESAVREIGLFFKAEELLSYDKAIDMWL
ncbi:nucleoside-diphosphate kinase [Listeria sp. SHR_NRA_18]|uniref:nucleoside-diphosphate kinase n=1 Tax=Listeria TaxID=1637 RepID=UPI00051D0945|nr:MULTISPECIES: nucleoside-diphosphate kinase [Listeria]KGL44825.1 nucleoside diphosphate kinase [Listeriaceae bacterium FSL A5-0209]KMT59790.1 multifunctional nucleoside diphosphate kinase/apyrimidinic endonuclease/3'-phosphodiesterase [Listeria newyorkensis]RQW68461.1 nucleoside-diphosphate kinase [Listeria sp. SHR_NRA_18]